MGSANRAQSATVESPEQADAARGGQNGPKRDVKAVQEALKYVNGQIPTLVPCDCGENPTTTVRPSHRLEIGEEEKRRRTKMSKQAFKWNCFTCGGVFADEYELGRHINNEGHHWRGTIDELLALSQCDCPSCQGRKPQNVPCKTKNKLHQQGWSAADGRTKRHAEADSIRLHGLGVKW